MKKEWGLLPKILSGEKTIESRWYSVKAAPWDKVSVGERIFFKNSGEPVTVVARVGRVVQIEIGKGNPPEGCGTEISTLRVRQILDKYGRRDGLGIDDLPRFTKLFKDKRYCILIFLKNPKEIKPFEIDKTGFGAQTAWLCLENINQVRKRTLDKPE